MYSPVNPSCTIIKCGVRGSPLHGHVFVMNSTRALTGYLFIYLFIYLSNDLNILTHYDSYTIPDFNIFFPI